jgi:hypothetical protein
MGERSVDGRTVISDRSVRITCGRVARLTSRLLPRLETACWCGTMSVTGHLARRR